MLLLRRLPATQLALLVVAIPPSAVGAVQISISSAVAVAGNAKLVRQALPRHGHKEKGR